MKRKKMVLSDMINAGINYFAFNRVKNSNGIKGWRYILEKPLTDYQYSIILKYQNTLVGGCFNRSAPEQKHQTLILFDKCI